MKRRFLHREVLFGLVGMCLTMPLHALDRSTMSGKDIMQESYERHEQFPYVYEEQTMVLMDKAERRDTRQLRRYSRIEDNGTVHNLLLFDDPPEVRGVGLLTNQQSDEDISTQIYLPAFGPQLIGSLGQNEYGSFLGTDFSIKDLIPEDLTRFRYERQDNELIEYIEHFVIDVYPTASDNTTPSHRHYIRTDIFYVTRTDNYDQHGRLHKRQTRHDLKPLDGHMWRADMILMEDMKTRHQSLIKINRRIFSRDYVPTSMFTLNWLVENQQQALATEEKEDDTSKASPNEQSDDSQTLNSVNHDHQVTMTSGGQR